MNRMYNLEASKQASKQSLVIYLSEHQLFFVARFFILEAMGMLWAKAYPMAFCCVTGSEMREKFIHLHR